MGSSEDWTGAYSDAGDNDPHENQGPLLVRTCWALIAISIIVVGGRLYAKIYKTRRLYWDDGLMILALVRQHWHSIHIFILADDKLDLWHSPCGDHHRSSPLWTW